MASSPPYNTSPPTPSLALPRQRPTVNTLALPTGAPNPRRKPSTASATSAIHPLRQTSFPPSQNNGSVAYSPEGSPDFSDTEIASAISGPSGPADGEGGGKKRKRAEKKTRGRPPKNPRAGSVDDARSGVNQRGNTAGADAEAEENEDEDEDDAAGNRGNTVRENEMFEEKNKEQLELVNFMDREQQWQFQQHAVWKRAKLRTADVRKLVNQTLSQSVPANVVTVVNGYSKMFAGVLIEMARDVQDEWLAVDEKRPDGEANVVAKRLGGEHEDGANGAGEKPVTSSAQTNGHANSDDTQPDAEMHNIGEKATLMNGHQEDTAGYDDGAMNLRRQIDFEDRGPLLPDHLREALRRYKKSRNGGTVGFTGLSLEGKDVAASRMGGRRLFR